MNIVSFDQLAQADLIVDALYEGRRAGNSGDDPLPALLGVSNQGGFRYLGNRTQPKLIVITSSFSDPDWPDSLDAETGVLTYYGDNKHAGRGLHETPRHGNLLLRNMYDALHARPARRNEVPPILVFGRGRSFRDVVFLGLAVPGGENLTPLEDLVAIWKLGKGQRFQNYRASMTILDVPTIKRNWLNDMSAGSPLTANCPSAWRVWVETGAFRALKATPSIEYRTPTQQVPTSEAEVRIINLIHRYFEQRPVGFEACAARITQLMDANFFSYELTRPSRDGGRDAIGLYRIGNGAPAINVDFALEAKCYALNNSVGVREISRLISRLRHRQFGVLVTTSYLNLQAYRELKEDRHPVLVIAGTDIVAILARNGLNSVSAVRDWLQAEFPDAQA